jgi:hypothetical protein
MKAVDIVAKRADVDSTKMGVTGGSYGGFMTAWVTTKTNRFKAAEADRMISDWTAWWGTTDVQGLTNNEFFGAPWENQVMYDTLSPIRFVKNVKTPTLIVQSEEDHRTPIATAEMWFQALRLQGVQAEFVRYPRSNHDLSRTGEPWLLVDRLGRLRQWFGHFLLDREVGSGDELTDAEAVRASTTRELQGSRGFIPRDLCFRMSLDVAIQRAPYVLHSTLIGVIESPTDNNGSPAGKRYAMTRTIRSLFACRLARELREAGSDHLARQGAHCG